MRKLHPVHSYSRLCASSRRNTIKLRHLGHWLFASLRSNDPSPSSIIGLSCSTTRIARCPLDATIAVRLADEAVVAVRANGAKILCDTPIYARGEAGGKGSFFCGRRIARTPCRTKAYVGLFVVHHSIPCATSYSDGTPALRSNAASHTLRVAALTSAAVYPATASRRAWAISLSYSRTCPVACCTARM